MTGWRVLWDRREHCGIAFVDFDGDDPEAAIRYKTEREHSGCVDVRIERIGGTDSVSTRDSGADV